MKKKVDQIVLYYGDHPRHVCPVIRVLAPAQLNGIMVDHGTERINGVLQTYPERVDDADLVIIQRDFPADVEAYEQVIDRARQAGKRIIYDIDDLLIDMPENHPDVERYIPKRLTSLRAIVEADAVTVASAALKLHLSQFNANVHLLPNYLLDSTWEGYWSSAAKEPVDDGLVTIGYMGGHSHAPDLEMVRPVLERLLEKFAGKLQLHFYGIEPPTRIRGHNGVQTTNVGYVDYIHFIEEFSRNRFDIFIAPLQDTSFNRHKSWLKYLEYSAMGIPGVFSDLEPYQAIVKHGVTGFLASDLNEWETQLSKLVEGWDLRQAIGQAAFKDVTGNYLLSDHAGQWRDYYERVLHQEQDPVTKDQITNSYHLATSWYQDILDDIHSQSEDIAAFTEKTQKLSEHIQQQEIELGQLSDEKQSLLGSIQNQKEELAGLRDQFAELESLQAQTENEVIERERTLEVKDAELDGLTRKLAQVEQQLEVIPKLEGQLDAARVRISKLSTEILQRDARIDTLERRGVKRRTLINEFSGSHFLMTFQKIRNRWNRFRLSFLRMIGLVHPVPMFDPDWYSNNWPDVVASGIDPYVHYRLWGWRQGRNPSAYFDVMWYLQNNEDVLSAGIEPLQHYLEYGRWEDRRPIPEPARESFPIHQSPWIPEKDRVDHQASGTRRLLDRLNFQFRWWRMSLAILMGLISPPPLFKKTWYLEQNPDVKHAGINPYLHYRLIGWREGRDPHPNFSVRRYLENYPDVREAGVEPFDHFLTYGWVEGRNPSSRVDTHSFIDGMGDHHRGVVALLNYSSDRKTMPLDHTRVEDRTQENNRATAKLSRRNDSHWPVDGEFAKPIMIDHYEHDEEIDLGELPVDLIAFYLPQFHPIPENDEFWGEGFTEWTNVRKAKALFAGHYQPREPGNLGYYDLRVADVMRQQAEVAKRHGIAGFCFHHYWFNGKRVLETPVDQFIAHPDIEIEFCLNWANENWTRRWDGADDQILLRQDHSAEDDLAFIEDAIRYFKDPRYIQIGGKPLFILYNPQRLPDPAATAARWREQCKSAGFAGLFLVAAQTFGFVDPSEIGFDAAVEFPPHNAFTLVDISSKLEFTSPFEGFVFDYNQLPEIYNTDQTDYTLFKTVVPGWDNTPRRGNRASVYHGSTPSNYQRWLSDAIKTTVDRNAPEHRYVFINAWNEWAESAYLEPDSRYGYAYLNATTRALQVAQRRPGTLLFLGHDSSRAGSQILLLNLLSWLAAHTDYDVRLILGRGGSLRGEYEAVVPTLVLDDFIDRPESEISSRVKAFSGDDVRLIYANSSVSGWMLPYVSDIHAPLLAHIHELEQSIEKFVGQESFEQIKAKADHIIAVSPPVRDNLVDRHGIAAEKISLVHAFIAPRKSSSQNKRATKIRLGMDPDIPVVLGCGSLEYRKGPDLFIEVAKKLKELGVERFHLYWVGRRTYDFDETFLHNLVDRYQVQDVVTFLGEKNNPEDYYEAADILLLPSREDPFPLVVLEAADHHVPSVCFEGSGGMPAFIAQSGQEGGLIVPMEDTQEMASAVKKLLQNRESREQFGENAYKNLHSQHTTDAAMPAIMECMRSTAGLKPGVSVIVPTYNHASFLPKRIDSILNQSFRDIEIIVIDDASTDETDRVLASYASRSGIRIKRNPHNSGSTFSQWYRGLIAARGDIIWIAEDDDFCDEHFLACLLPYFDDKEVKLAYTQSYAVDEQGEILFSYKGYTDDISEIRWSQPYVALDTEEVNIALAVKNTIPNASGVIFRRFDMKAWSNEWIEKQLSGDWAFYLYAIEGGKIAFHPEHLNYHRRHENTNIHRTRNSPERFMEYLEVQRLALTLYPIAENTLQRMREAALAVWKETHPESPQKSFEESYSIRLVSLEGSNGDYYKKVRGYCPICESPRTFVADGEWLRGDYRCEACRSVPRDRALRRVLDEHFPEWKKGVVHEIAPSNSYIKNAASDYSFSQYDPNREPGVKIDGSRNENLEKLTWSDASIEFLIHLDVLEHVFHPDEAMREMVRVLRPGGAAVFTVQIHSHLERSVRRATLDEGGTIDHLLPPEFHGDPVGDGRALVIWDYGKDFIDLIKSWLGEDLSIEIDHINETYPRMGIEGEYLDVVIIHKLESKTGLIAEEANFLDSDSRNHIYQMYTDHSDDEWYKALLRSVENPLLEGIQFPSFPKNELQMNMVGFSGREAIEDAYRFYKEIKQALYQLDYSLGPDSRILDFGCGFGRHLRFFLKDVHSENLFGVDIDQDFVEICRNTFPHATFSQNSILPSGQFPDMYFNLIYAYSVFSHLNRHVSTAWIEEFARIIKPGGVLILTTHPRRFIDFCDSLRSNPTKMDEHPWYKRLAESAFLDPEDAHRDFEAGNFVFSSTDSGPVRTSEFYGEAVISPEFVRKEWLKEFDLIDFVDDEARLSQALMILRRRPIDQASREHNAPKSSLVEIQKPSRSVRSPKLKKHIFHGGRRPTAPAEKLVLPDLNAIYVVIPKTGCTSVKQFFSKYYGWKIVDNVHNPQSEIYEHISFQPLTNEPGGNFYTFTFVRNPFSRLYSVYKSKRYPGIDHPNFVDGIEAGLYRMGFRTSHSFSEFVHLVCETPDLEADPHVRSQVTFVLNEQGEIRLDEFFQFEDFRANFVRLGEKLGVAIDSREVPWENKSMTSPLEYIHAYDKKLIDAVLERYIEDFQCFGYSERFI